MYEKFRVNLKETVNNKIADFRPFIGFLKINKFKPKLKSKVNLRTR
jgi:hypothetical protein